MVRGRFAAVWGAAVCGLERALRWLWLALLWRCTKVALDKMRYECIVWRRRERKRRRREEEKEKDPVFVEFLPLPQLGGLGPCLGRKERLQDERTGPERPLV